jgi:CHAD domain-containing protein
MALLIQDLSHGTHQSSPALSRIAGAVDEEREAARTRLAAKLPTSKLRRLADRIDQAVNDQDAGAGRSRQPRPERLRRQGWLWAVDARAARRAATLEGAINAAGALYDPVRLHDVRIALKKLRYAMELSLEARQRRGRGDLVALKNAQELLGHIHDLEMLIAFARRMQMSQEPPDLTASRDLESLLGALARECRALHARFMHDRTKILAIADRIGHAISPRPSAGRRIA